MTLTSQEIPSQVQPTSTSAVTLTLRSFVAGKMVPVQTGVCFPKGQLVSANAAQICGFEEAVTAQVDVLNRWHDGSVRWALLSFVAPDTSAGTRLLIAENWHVSGAESQGMSSVVTNVRIQRDEISLHVRDLAPDNLRQYQIHMTPRLHDTAGAERTLEMLSVREECAGPIRQVFLITATLQTAPFITIQFRLTHWKSSGTLQLETRLRNTRRARHNGGLWDLGDSGSFHFRSFEIGLRSEELPATSEIRWKVQQDQAERISHSEVFLIQCGSGGRFWNSTNHVDAEYQSSVVDRGYIVASEFGALRGHRAEPTFLLSGDQHHLTVAVPEFWQNFPSGIGAAMGSLEVALFPKVGTTTYELQGGEQKTQSFFLHYGNGAGSIDQLNWVYQPPVIAQTAESIAEAHVLPWFAASPSSNDGNVCAQRFQQYLEAATTGHHSIDARRESIDEYGWRNFGDVPADHEQTHYAGSNTIVSHYNNQFDMIYGAILQWLSSGDVRWTQLFGPLARHVMDIDLYHTLGDRAAFNGGLFWHTDHYVDARTSTHRTYSKYNAAPGKAYGGGPSCEHNYTTGLMHYYFLTGHPEARESVLLLADWVLRMDDGSQTIFGLFDDGPTGAASATVFEDFHGPGRGAGNSVNALLDAWILSGSERYLQKAEELIRRCVSPLQNPDDLHLLDAEGHWSYTVFLNSLGRYLLAKRDAEQFDQMYSYARDTFAVYGRWMATNERRTLDRPEELQYPTEAWAAQDFRKCNVMRIAATCVDDAFVAQQLRRRADEIHEAAWKDLEAFGDARFTARCLSILMTEGHREVFHRTGGIDACPKSAIQAIVAPWTMFVPQKQRVRQLLKSPGRLLKSSLKLLNPGRLWRTAKAAQRQFL
ncbi:MAG: hypothetical protein U0996_11870 [Planctomycetaceae bacterium]